MQITVFGANGKVGNLVVKICLKRGYKVMAFVYGKSDFSESDDLKIIQGDIHNRTDVDIALLGSDAVISALGSWGTKEKDILSSGMINIVASMKIQQIRRIISLTGADARFNNENPKLINKISSKIISIINPKVFSDGEKHIQILDESSLDWTVVRSPVMNELGSKTDYKLNLVPLKPWDTINRSAVARCMVDQLESQDYIKQSPYISRK